MSRASSAPLITSTAMPVWLRIWRMSWARFEASRTALVATARTALAPARWASLAKRSRAAPVRSMAASERRPVRNTCSPNRTAARSSASTEVRPR